MNQREFLDIVLPIKDSLYRLAKSYLISRDEAQDAIQEVFLKLWKNKESIKNYNSPEAFAFTMTKNYCLDRLKSKQASTLKIVHTNFENRTNLDKDIEAKDEVSLFFTLMQKLPEQQKLILHLRDVEQYEFSEIAKITASTQAKCSCNTLKSSKKDKGFIIKTIQSWSTVKSRIY